MHNLYDVVVFGGGTAGVVAAIQSAREGAKTLLIEKSSRLGGTITNAGIPYPSDFFANGRQIIAGIGLELIRETLIQSGCKFEINKKAYELNPFIYASVCDEYVINSGCDLLFHTMPAKLEFNGSKWEITICTKTGLKHLSAKVLIDCTGDANAAEIAKMPLIIPERTQPATLCFRFSGCESDKIDFEQLNAEFAKAVANGELKPEDATWRIDNLKIDRIVNTRGSNANHIRTDANSRTSEGRTKLEIEARMAVRRLYRWLARQPGFNSIKLDAVYPETGVRENVVIEGETFIRLEDYESGRLWPDSLCYAYYVIDLHGIDSAEWKYWPLKENTFPTIPRGALIPKGSRNFLVAGRILSADRLAHSALRVEASCMAMGQAAGVMAALSSRLGLTPLELDISQIKSTLKKHNAIVPE